MAKPDLSSIMEESKSDRLREAWIKTVKARLSLLHNKQTDNITPLPLVDEIVDSVMEKVRDVIQQELDDEKSPFIFGQEEKIFTERIFLEINDKLEELIIKRNNELKIAWRKEEVRKQLAKKYSDLTQGARENIIDDFFKKNESDILKCSDYIFTEMVHEMMETARMRIESDRKTALLSAEHVVLGSVFKKANEYGDFIGRNNFNNPENGINKPLIKN